MNEIEKALPEQYTPMLARIDTVLPLAKIDTENFNKSSSQFKVATLDVVDLTPINSAKHLLAVVQRTRQAIEEASITLRRKQVELKRKELELMSSEGTDTDELVIDIDELKMQIDNIEASGRGAVRRLANALDQYQAILDALGKDHLTELDYENDQARYHIMTAFNQALTAARARGGLIDEGNHIYLFQLGINGAVAQREITALLEAEQEALNEGMAPTHEGVVKWLNLVADKFEKAPELYAAQRNMKTLNTDLLLENKQMKLIKYTLNSDGTIPSYVTDGGYLAVANANSSPQDLDLIGVANDDAPQEGFANEAALLSYVEEKNLEFKDPITEEIIPLETIVSSIWGKLS